MGQTAGLRGRNSHKHRSRGDATPGLHSFRYHVVVGLCCLYPRGGLLFQVVCGGPADVLPCSTKLEVRVDAPWGEGFLPYCLLLLHKTCNGPVYRSLQKTVGQEPEGRTPDPDR